MNTEIKDIDDVITPESDRPQKLAEGDNEDDFWNFMSGGITDEYQEWAQGYESTLGTQIRARHEKIEELEGKIEDWSSRTYDRGKDVQVGGGHSARKMNVQAINRRKRDKKVARLKEQRAAMVDEIERLQSEKPDV